MMTPRSALSPTLNAGNPPNNTLVDPPTTIGGGRWGRNPPGLVAGPRCGPRIDPATAAGNAWTNTLTFGELAMVVVIEPGWPVSTASPTRAAAGIASLLLLLDF